MGAMEGGKLSQLLGSMADESSELVCLLEIEKDLAGKDDQRQGQARRVKCLEDGSATRRNQAQVARASFPVYVNHVRLQQRSTFNDLSTLGRPGTPPFHSLESVLSSQIFPAGVRTEAFFSDNAKRQHPHRSGR